ncbi:MAG: hypothetical protein HYS27_27840 [Deltaproteobacteria bacterium]|nr:hypothetical protein [Deltaproteobacteria bacterium]
MTPGGIATRHSPSFALVQAHFGVGMVGMAAFAAALVWFAARLAGAEAGQLGSHYFQPTLLGLVHLCVLGWFLPVALGAMHQLLPVVFEVPVRSERLAWTGLALYLPGAAGLILHLWGFRLGVGLVASATLLFAAVLVYVTNLVATLRAAKSVPQLGWFVLAALAWLVFAAGLGLALAWNLHAPFVAGDHLEGLRAHAHAAALGFFGLLIMGVALRLMEMFLLAYVDDVRAARVALVLVNLALVALVAQRLVVSSPTLAAVLEGLSVLAAVSGIAAFLTQVGRLWFARMKRHVEVPWWHALASFSYLAVAGALGAVVALVPASALESLAVGLPERLALAYGFIALAGFIGSIIVGQLYKIWPFLVWFHRFSPLVGLKKVPTASELVPLRSQRVQWAAHHVGVVLFAVGVLLPPGGPLPLIGAASFALAVALFLFHMAIVARSRP